jgi:hypothetical protein
LHSIQGLGGLIVSVTTDGFICNITDLEQKLTENFLLSEFKKIRKELAEDNTALEIKNVGRGIMAWTTRGQLGLESKIIATTGIQHKAFEGKDAMLKTFLKAVKSESKTIEYVQGRLRSASEIYKKGGHVTMVRRDQLFRLHFDNRRVLEWETSIPASIENLVDSKPLEEINQGKNLRFIARLCKNKQYGKYTNIERGVNLYKDNTEIAIRKFLVGLLSTPPRFNLNRESFYSYASILEYLSIFNPASQLTVRDISVLQNRVKEIGNISLPLKKTKESEEFVKYIQQEFKEFDLVEFYGLEENK